MLVTIHFEKPTPVMLLLRFEDDVRFHLIQPVLMLTEVEVAVTGQSTRRKIRRCIAFSSLLLVTIHFESSWKPTPVTLLLCPSKVRLQIDLTG